jgi:hypothetical protein
MAFRERNPGEQDVFAVAAQSCQARIKYDFSEFGSLQ